MSECKLTEFGLRVKTKLLEMGKSQKWLIESVVDKTGLYMDGGYMYKILTGRENSKNIISAIKEILGMEET